MDKFTLSNQLKDIAEEIFDRDPLIADALNKISDHLTKESEYAHDEANFEEMRRRVKILSNILIEVTDLYETTLSAKQISYSNDLVEKVAVGCFNDEGNDSSFAQQLRFDNYKIAVHDAEFSIKVRLTNLLQELMPSGAWIVE